MKALVYTGIENFAYCDVANPVPDIGEVLIKVESVGICGSDMHAYLGHDDRRPAPLILGHEAAGRIVGGSRDGERVAINPLMTCGTCLACCSGRDNLCSMRQIISMPPCEGAFAEFITIPETNLVTVPNAVSLDKAALVEPIAVSWHAVRLGLDALQSPTDHRAVIIGGGAIGLAAALVLKGRGIDEIVVVEPNSMRRDYLNNRCGVLAKAKVEGLFAIVIDAVGYAETRATASMLASPGGVIVHIGLSEDVGGLDVRRMTLQEISFIGTYTYTAQDFRDTAQAIFNGHLGALNWIETRPLSDGHTAFQNIQTGSISTPKIILKPAI